MSRLPGVMNIEQFARFSMVWRKVARHSRYLFPSKAIQRLDNAKGVERTNQWYWRHVCAPPPRMGRNGSSISKLPQITQSLSGSWSKTLANMAAVSQWMFSRNNMDFLQRGWGFSASLSLTNCSVITRASKHLRWYWKLFSYPHAVQLPWLVPQ